MTFQHLTEVLLAGRIEPGATSAHRRGPGVWPACKSDTRSPGVNSSSWVELSAGRALELGAVPCAASGCAEVTA